MYGEEVELVFDFSKVKQLGYTLYDGQKEQRIPITYNHRKLKEALNKLFKDRHFIEGSLSMNRVDALVHNLLTGDGLEIYMGEKGADGNLQEKYVVHTIPNFPWGVTK